MREREKKKVTTSTSTKYGDRIKRYKREDKRLDEGSSERE